MNGTGLVVLPTYNEREGLEAIVASVLDRDARLEVLVVDDASPDGTGDLADALAERDGRVHVLHREGKLGLGSAYIAGFRWALRGTFDWIFEMDADGSHDPRYLTDLLEATADYDVVVGSRYTQGVNVINWPMSRLLLSYYANKYARWVTGLRLADATSGFKCFKREVLERLELGAVQSTGYAFQIEMNFRAWKKGFRVGEVPIVFTDRVAGESKMSGAIVREAVWRVWGLRLRAMFRML
ncbi:MAG: polyprenol monophosphomannose synthase [Gemmatimonadetes bacterium]|nr:polyprenol monophosphomannose synthase [Gemmatimonadota bacterium]